MSGTICVPGQRLVAGGDEYISGYGTYERQGYIYASLAGIIQIIEKEMAKLIQVQTELGHTLVPKPGDIVTAHVTSISQRLVRCLIKCIGDTVIQRPFRGVIRKEDIRATLKDETLIHECFRPGDIILARALPVNELNSFPLSTAENELGVVIAMGEAGVGLIPVSWTEMQCPKTYNKEKRKVARVVPESITVD